MSRGRQNLFLVCKGKDEETIVDKVSRSRVSFSRNDSDRHSVGPVLSVI